MYNWSYWGCIGNFIVAVADLLTLLLSTFKKCCLWGINDWYNADWKAGMWLWYQRWQEWCVELDVAILILLMWLLKQDKRLCSKDLKAGYLLNYNTIFANDAAGLFVCDEESVVFFKFM